MPLNVAGGGCRCNLASMGKHGFSLLPMPWVGRIYQACSCLVRRGRRAHTAFREPEEPAFRSDLLGLPLGILLIARAFNELDELLLAVQAKLGIDVLDVGLHGPLGDGELVGYGLRVMPSG